MVVVLLEVVAVDVEVVVVEVEEAVEVVEVVFSRTLLFRYDHHKSFIDVLGFKEYCLATKE